MALIRVTRCWDIVDPRREDEVIMNTAHITLVYADTHNPCRGVWVHMVHGEPILVKLTFDEIWTLIQRET